MRSHGKLKLGFYPLPASEARRLRNCISFPSQCSALDPCVGDGVAFAALLEGTQARRYGIELDSYRAEQARCCGIETLQADTLDVRCPVETLSLLYLNPPYDWEMGQSGNRRLELVFLEHTYRWLRSDGVLVLVVPQSRLKPCARILAEHFNAHRIYRLTEPECQRYDQVVILAVRRKRSERLQDSRLLDLTQYLEQLSAKTEIEPLGDVPGPLYPVPESAPVALNHVGAPLDEVEDALLQSAAYRQAARILIREQSSVRGRPLTPLHGGHVGLLCTAGMLNGVFGEGETRHIAHWRSVKFTDHWQDDESDGTVVMHDRERFSHELTLIFASGETQVLTHEKKDPS
jgi:tRNA1(Val) A37 N6-methylase TrmN6